MDDAFILEGECPFCGSRGLATLHRSDPICDSYKVKCPKCDAGPSGTASIECVQSGWNRWCENMAKVKSLTGLESPDASCEDCRYYDSNGGRDQHCDICRGTGSCIPAEPVCGLFVRRGEESDRNEHGLRPCICGERNVSCISRSSGWGMGATTARYIHCPSCGMMRDADDFGVGWNLAMKELEEGFRKRFGGME